MILSRLKIHCIFISAWLCLQWGCAANPDPLITDSGQNAIAPSPAMAAEDTITILFLRQSNYMGGGRIHILRLDDRDIGELTENNYYRIEVWPGEYRLSVFMPTEIFFGQTHPGWVFTVHNPVSECLKYVAVKELVS